MLKGRGIASAVLLACGLVAAGNPAALAEGEAIATKVSITPKHAKVTNAKKGTPVALHYDTTISKSDGSRPSNAESGSLTLPKGALVDVTGMKACPLDKLQNNDDKSCPKNSVAGSAGGLIDTSPISETPMHTDGVIYYTGKKGGLPTFATYYTVRELPSAHNIATHTFKKSGGRLVWRWEIPRLATAPGLPDATPLEVIFDWTVKSPKRMVFRLGKKCTSAALTHTVTFYDNPSVADQPKPAC